MSDTEKRASTYSPRVVPAQVIDADSLVETAIHHILMAWHERDGGDEDGRTVDGDRLMDALTCLGCARNELAWFAKGLEASESDEGQTHARAQ